MDLQHKFRQASEGQPCFPELDRAHVAQGRVDPRVAVEPHPLVGPLPQMLGAGNDSRWTSPLFRLLSADSITALSYGQPFSDRDLSMPKTSSISSIEALANLLPRMPCGRPGCRTGEPHGGERRLHQAGVAPVADRVPDDLAVAGGGLTSRQT